MRDNFLPATLQAKLATLELIKSLPRLDVKTWGLGIALIAVIAVLEGAYRVHQQDQAKPKRESIPGENIPVSTAVSAVRSPAPAAEVKPYLIERKPLWKDIYGRDEGGHRWLSEQLGPSGPWGYWSSGGSATSAILAFEAKRYLRSVRARLTYLYSAGDEITVRQGCWLDSEYGNEIDFRTGDIRYLVAYICFESENDTIAYAVFHDQRNQGGTIPNMGLSADKVALTEGSRIKVEFFIGGNVGPEFAYETYTSEGRIELRSIVTKQSTKE